MKKTIITLNNFLSFYRLCSKKKKDKDKKKNCRGCKGYTLV